MSRVRVLICAISILTTLVAVPSSYAQTYNVLYTFSDGPNGFAPQPRLVLDPNGNLYGSAEFGGIFNRGTIFELDKAGQLKVLYDFSGGADGWEAVGGLVRAGNLYGAAELGGANGYGTIFELNKKGKLTNPYSFTGGTDGAGPNSTLVRDSAGNFYGMAGGGGDLNCNPSYGCGTVFELDQTGSMTAVLHTFTGGSADGAYPTDGQSLARDGAGNMYGVTAEGGSGGCSKGCGTVFKIDSARKFTLLHSFTGGADGSLPGSVILAGKMLYGSTGLGGDACPEFGSNGCGVIFTMDPTTGTETVLYSFAGGADGAFPWDLTRDESGNLYGATFSGGDFGCSTGQGYGCGTVFKLDVRRNLTVLHAFTGGLDGTPGQGQIFLVRDLAGNLYGTTTPFSEGGNTGWGTVFKVTLYLVSFSPASLTFPAQTVGTTSAPKTVTLFNNQSVTLNISSIAASANYSAVPGGTHPCGSVVAANSNCTFLVRFSPMKTGTINGTVTVTDDAPTSPQVVGLTGKGQ